MAAIYDISEKRADDLEGEDLEVAYRVVLTQNRVLNAQLDKLTEENRILLCIASYVKDKSMPDFYKRMINEMLYPRKETP